MKKVLVFIEFALNFSGNYDLVEKLYQTREGVFYLISKHIDAGTGLLLIVQPTSWCLEIKGNTFPCV